MSAWWFTDGRGHAFNTYLQGKYIHKSSITLLIYLLNLKMHVHETIYTASLTGVYIVAWMLWLSLGLRLKPGGSEWAWELSLKPGGLDWGWEVSPIPFSSFQYMFKHGCMHQILYGLHDLLSQVGHGMETIVLHGFPNINSEAFGSYSMPNTFVKLKAYLTNDWPLSGSKDIFDKSNTQWPVPSTM